VRNSLVAALAACAETPLRSSARRFLAGLSCDELQFIAGFFGGCILETSAGTGLGRCMRGGSTRTTGLPAADLDHKLILVHEYLCRSRSSATEQSRLDFAARAGFHRRLSRTD
jgi:hypothetical protein